MMRERVNDCSLAVYDTKSHLKYVKLVHEFDPFPSDILIGAIASSCLQPGSDATPTDFDVHKYVSKTKVWVQQQWSLGRARKYDRLKRRLYETRSIIYTYLKNDQRVEPQNDLLCGIRVDDSLDQMQMLYYDLLEIDIEGGKIIIELDMIESKTDTTVFVHFS